MSTLFTKVGYSDDVPPKGPPSAAPGSRAFVLGDTAHTIAVAFNDGAGSPVAGVSSSLELYAWDRKAGEWKSVAQVQPGSVVAGTDLVLTYPEEYTGSFGYIAIRDVAGATMPASIVVTGTAGGTPPAGAGAIVAAKVALADAAALVAAANVEDAIAELAAPLVRVVRGVITSQASLNAYTGSGTGVLTAGSNGAMSTQDGLTLVAGDVVFLPPIVTGATIAAKDTGPWVVTSLGGASAKIVLTRPTWWAHGAAIPLAADIKVGGEGTKWKGNTWRTFTAAGRVIDTGDPVFYPRLDHGTGAVGSQTTGVYAASADCVSAEDTATAAALKTAVGSVGNGTATLDFTGTGTDAVRWRSVNF